MEPERFFSLLERSQPAGSAILCFDENYRITFISAGARTICFDLWGLRLKESDYLPTQLRCFGLASKSAKSSRDGESPEPLILRGNAETSVKVRLVHDPDKIHHCLIFEREAFISDPKQLNLPELSSRETEIAFWIYQKKTNWEIGKILSISVRTVDKHVENIFRKLGVNDRQSLAKNLTESQDLTLSNSRNHQSGPQKGMITG